MSVDPNSIPKPVNSDTSEATTYYSRRRVSRPVAAGAAALLAVGVGAAAHETGNIATNRVKHNHAVEAAKAEQVRHDEAVKKLDDTWTNLREQLDGPQVLSGNGSLSIIGDERVQFPDGTKGKNLKVVARTLSDETHLTEVYGFAAQIPDGSAKSPNVLPNSSFSITMEQTSLPTPTEEKNDGSLTGLPSAQIENIYNDDAVASYRFSFAKNETGEWDITVNYHGDDETTAQHFSTSHDAKSLNVAEHLDTVTAITDQVEVLLDDGLQGIPLDIGFPEDLTAPTDILSA